MIERTRELFRTWHLAQANEMMAYQDLCQSIQDMVGQEVWWGPRSSGKVTGVRGTTLIVERPFRPGRQATKITISKVLDYYVRKTKHGHRS